MPVAQGLRLGAVRGIVIGLAGLGAGVGAMLLMLWLAGTSDKIEVYLGDDDFRGIHAASLAAGIARDGPVPFPDLAGRDRPIWITHHGDDPTVGWSAFSARVPGRSDSCLVQWDATAGLFVDSCDSSNTFPATGAGLEQLAWRVVRGELRVEIHTSTDGTTP